MQSTPSSLGHLRIDGISRSYGTRRVLTDLSLVVDRRDRLGLIGENGAGKSTLLRILAGDERPDVGSVLRPDRVGLLRQEVRSQPDDTVGELLERALADIRRIERELQDAAVALANPEGREDPAGRACRDLTDETESRYSAALTAAELADVWAVDARRDEILAGLGVAGIPLDRRIDSVSGGQRSRFALAALLLGRPTALLLDEPTNHLDDAATGFLREQLIRWSGPVVFASHDRQFLDEVATSLLDIDPSRKGSRRFGGTFTEYLAAKSAERARWEAQFAAEQDELRRLKYQLDVVAPSIGIERPMKDRNKASHDLHGMRVASQAGRRIRSAHSRLEALQLSQVRKPDALLAFSGIPRGTHALDDAVLIQLTDALVPGRLGIRSLAIRSKNRLLVTGDNGSGKSSLLSALAGILPLESGTVNRRKDLRIGLLEQDVRWADATLTPRTIYERTVGERRSETLPLAGLGLIAPRDLDRAVAELSIGQQRRLALALIIARPPHLFLLDEPTNHLSLGLATELEDALGAYPGAVVVASHDRWLRSRWTGDRVRLEQGSLFG